MEKGRLSWSKVRALTRMATAENEARLVEFALHHTASQVERFVRAAKSAEAAMAAPDGTSEMAARRHLTVRMTADGMYEVRGLLMPEVGALLVETLDVTVDELHRQECAMEREADAAMEREADAATGEPDPPTPGPMAGPQPTPPPGLRPSPTERRHDALGAWLEERAEARAQLVVHTVAGGPEILATEDGSHVPAGTSRRLACDAETVEVKRGRDGSVLDVGRRQRTVGWRLRKALDVRDGGCRFPGCGSRHTQAHHAIPWSEGGETKLDNLTLLCRFHHRAVHEGGWRVEMGEAGAARFRDPTGTRGTGGAPGTRRRQGAPNRRCGTRELAPAGGDRPLDGDQPLDGRPARPRLGALGPLGTVRDHADGSVTDGGVRAANVVGTGC